MLAPSLFQLETRSTGVSLRCLSTGTEHREELCLSAILSDHENSCQVTRGGWQLILITPVWPTQPWYPVLLDMSIAPPVLFSQVPKLFTHPVGDLQPLVQNKTLFLAAWHVSNNQSQQEAYRTGLTNSFWHLGDQAQIQCKIQPGINGTADVRRGNLIHFTPIITNWKYN